MPDVIGLLVFGVDRHPELFRRQVEVFGEELPGEMNGILLEIVAEREVPEHFEEGVMTGGVADVVEVIVLAAGADALLRRCGALIGAMIESEVDVLELIHAGIGKEKRRVVAGNDGAGRDQPEATSTQSYTVVSGDTLSGIARKLTGSTNWRTIYEQNKGVIGSNPNMIKPGQVLTIPGAKT